MIDLAPFVGLPYVERGCWELVRTVYRDALHINLPAFRDEYEQLSMLDRKELAELITTKAFYWQSVLPGAERVGDAVLFRIIGAPSHIGVVAGQGKFLHVLDEGHASCIESYRSPKWKQRVEGFYRHREASF